MNPKIYSALALVLWTAWSSVACSGELQAKTFGKKTYEGSRDRAYQVYIPDTVTTSDPVPMVMVLHGCKRTERNMIDETGFKELADREKFVVVYPFITDWDRVQENRAENCWGFWFHATLVSVRRSRITLTGLSLVSSFAVPSQASCKLSLLHATWRKFVSPASRASRSPRSQYAGRLRQSAKGDLCSYASDVAWSQPLSSPELEARRAELHNAIHIYTPGREDGRPLCLPVIPEGLAEMKPTERELAAKHTAGALAGMRGYKANSNDLAKTAVLQKP